MSNRGHIKGHIFVISAPSGSGKTTLCNRLLKARMGLSRAVSFTTRLPREGERNGRDYFFVTETEFVKMRKRGGFLEWTKAFGNFYGTSRQEFERILRSQRDVILTLDVNGATQVRRLYKSASLIFILPPSIKELRERLLRRSSDSERALKRRLAFSRREIGQLKNYDYCVVNNDIEKATAELKAIIIAERRRVK